MAQARPDAGQTLKSVRPAPALPGEHSDAALPGANERPALSAPAGARVVVRTIHITGARVYTESKLGALVQDAVGRTLTLAELQALAHRITLYYRSHGYLLTRAYLPAQEIRNGQVEIAVLEGRIGSVNLQNHSRVKEGVAQAYIQPLQKPDSAAEGAVLERSLLLLNDLPGVEARSTLRPGATVGTADLDVQVQGRPLVSGSLDFDNYGNRYTGEYRAGTTVNFNNPSGYGDQFSLRAIDTGPGMQYARAAWQAPLGSRGLKAGMAYSNLRYRLGRDFETLGAHGNAQVATLWAAYPLIRSQNRNLNVQVSYDSKRLEDLIDAVASDSRKKITVWTFGLSGDRSDDFQGGGVSLYSLNLVGGHLQLDAVSQVLDQGPGGHGTAGDYNKVAYSYARLQRLTGQLSFYAAVTGQAASKNLDSSEKLSLGGAYGVRAYPEGEAAADTGAVLNLELRWTLPALREVQAIGFYDAGAARIEQNVLASDSNNRRHLAGEGLGVQWLHDDSFALKAYLAWRAGPQPVSDSDRDPRLWLQAAKYF
jgi:hemolysin activation/secretion protein